MSDEEDEDEFGGMYEDGHWVWDDESGSLLFVSDLPPQPVETVQIPSKIPTGAIEFRDNVDLMEQFRYRRRFQRKLKPGQADVIALQDIVDIAIYTAPINILTPQLISMLHLPTTARFLRALILYCAYYLQIAEEMARRIKELETKIKSPECKYSENDFRENLYDLRNLVAKEYCLLLIGGRDTKKFHHMGPSKKRKSLSDKDARLYEMLIRMSVQIVWIALGRQCFHKIELEISRILKSDIFNAVEHTLKTGYMAKMAPLEREVLLGYNLRHDQKLNTRSPLMNEVFSDRKTDFRLMGLGVVKYPMLSTRLQYLRLAVAGNEEDLTNFHVVLGIIGLPRSSFDIMLKPLPIPTDKSKSKASSLLSPSQGRNRIGASSSSSLKKAAAPRKLYPPIALPTKPSKEEPMPYVFPEELEPARPINEIQLHRWQTRLMKLRNPSLLKYRSSCVVANSKTKEKPSN